MTDGVGDFDIGGYSKGKVNEWSAKPLVPCVRTKQAIGEDKGAGPGCSLSDPHHHTCTASGVVLPNHVIDCLCDDFNHEGYGPSPGWQLIEFHLDDCSEGQRVDSHLDHGAQFPDIGKPFDPHSG